MSCQLAFDFDAATPALPDPQSARRARGALGYHAGMAAEEGVIRTYARRGHACLHQRWRGTAGEIDLILQDGVGLIFVEVKKSDSFSRAAERLGPAQMRRLCAAAEEFAGTQPLGSLTDMRFDVALVDSTGAVRILENALLAA
ncbi:YraN family protein [Thalassococcus sp. BH17M4-6]|uniref:YraN family protein n=1 Tax=Thalassococcus sp. BH17M4-6 TaxID=3413148 RepID=UPI003BC78B07